MLRILHEFETSCILSIGEVYSPSMLKLVSFSEDYFIRSLLIIVHFCLRSWNLSQIPKPGSVKLFFMVVLYNAQTMSTT